jgi:hypothetical protein
MGDVTPRWQGLSSLQRALKGKFMVNDALLIEKVSDYVLRVTINRPNKRNAVNGAVAPASKNRFASQRATPQFARRSSSNNCRIADDAAVQSGGGFQTLPRG